MKGKKLLFFLDLTFSLSECKLLNFLSENDDKAGMKQRANDIATVRFSLFFSS